MQVLGDREWLLGTGRPGLVSYVIPAFNAEEFIAETLESCFIQDHRPLEVVVVDDGSTDRTAQIVRECERRYRGPSFQIVYRYQTNLGANAARNHALKASKGEVIGFLDADDLLPRARTSHLREVMAEFEADLVYGPDHRFRHKSEVAQFLAEDGEASAATIERASCEPVAKWVPNIWSFLARREVVERVGPLAEELRSCLDADYSIRIRCVAPTMYRTSRIVNLYRRHQNSMVDKGRRDYIRNALRSTELIEAILRKQGVCEAENAAWVRRRFRRIGLWALRSGLREEAAVAYDSAGRAGGAMARLGHRALVACFKVPLVVPLTGHLIRARSDWWAGSESGSTLKRVSESAGSFLRRRA